MRTRILLAVLVSTALLAGCDRGAFTERLGGDPNGLLDDAEGAPEEESFFSDYLSAPQPKLAVAWTDAADATAQAQLSFTVTNTTENPITFTAAVLAETLLGDAERPLGEATLNAGEVAAFAVDASDLPVRSEIVVGMISVKLARTIESPDGERTIGTRTASRYFRHAAGYGAVRTYTEASLQTELDGVLFSGAPPSGAKTAEAIEAALAATALGEVTDGAEGFTSISAAASRLVVRDELGQMLGFTTEAKVGADVASDDAEMEVADE